MPFSGPAISEPVVIDDLLGRGLQHKPDQPAVVGYDQTLTWRELDNSSTRLAHQYLALGLECGDRVASLLPNSSALIVHYLACLKAGLAATPLSYRYVPRQIDHALEVSGAGCLVYHVERESDVDATTLGRQLAHGVVRFGAPEGIAPRFEELVATGSREQLPPVASDTPYIMYFTSGSTGKPKGVAHSRATYGTLLASAGQSMQLTEQDVFLSGASISHAGGSLFSLAALSVGSKVVLPRTTDGHALLPVVREHRPTVIWILPVPLIALTRDHQATREDFASVRLCVSGGDKVPAELELEFTELTGFSIDEAYGMTEIGAVTFNPPNGLIKEGSVGVLAAGYQASIRDEQGNEVPAGTPGRFWVRAPATLAGYWNHPEATAAALVDGWFDTGDVMRVDEDGYLWFLGRKKEIIVHDGANISPQETEEALLEHPAVECAGVVGVHDPLHGENVRGYITLKPGAARPSGADVIRLAREKVGFQAPDEIVILDKMPFNAAGKVDRVTLKRYATEGLPQATQL